MDLAVPIQGEHERVLEDGVSRVLEFLIGLVEGVELLDAGARAGLILRAKERLGRARGPGQRFGQAAIQDRERGDHEEQREGHDALAHLLNKAQGEQEQKR